MVGIVEALRALRWARRERGLTNFLWPRRGIEATPTSAPGSHNNCRTNQLAFPRYGTWRCRRWRRLRKKANARLRGLEWPTSWASRANSAFTWVPLRYARFAAGNAGALAFACRGSDTPMAWRGALMAVSLSINRRRPEDTAGALLTAFMDKTKESNPSSYTMLSTLSLDLWPICSQSPL